MAAPAPRRLHIVPQTGHNDFSMGTVRYWLQHSRPYALRLVEARVSASVGVAVHPTAGDTAEDLMRRADEAMYQAKKLGKARYLMAT